MPFFSPGIGLIDTSTDEPSITGELVFTVPKCPISKIRTDEAWKVFSALRLVNFWRSEEQGQEASGEAKCFILKKSSGLMRIRLGGCVPVKLKTCSQVCQLCSYFLQGTRVNVFIQKWKFCHYLLLSLLQKHKRMILLIILQFFFVHRAVVCFTEEQKSYWDFIYILNFLLYYYFF